MAKSPDNRVIRRAAKQARSRAAVENICSATLEVVMQGGLSALNTNRVAQEAGVDVSSIYRFFPNKQAIIRFILERWLGEIRAVWDRFETDGELLELPWREYFTKLSTEWQVPGTEENYRALAGAWDTFPELRPLDLEHRAHFTGFFSRQMERFGARGSSQQWRDLAVFLYAVEDEVHALAEVEAFSSLGAGRDLFVETMLSLLEQHLP